MGLFRWTDEANQQGPSVMEPAPLGVARTRALRHRGEVQARPGRVRRWRRGLTTLWEAPEGSRDRSLAGKARIRARKAPRRG